MGDLHHLHRVVHLPVRTLDDVAGEQGAEAQHKPDMFEALRARRPSTLQRIGDALGSPFGLGVYLGFYAGCLVTVGAAYLWSVAL